MGTINFKKVSKRIIDEPSVHCINEPLLVGNEKKYLIKCIESGWIPPEGPFVKKFEEQFSTHKAGSWGIAVSSGTVA